MATTAEIPAFDLSMKKKKKKRTPKPMEEATEEMEKLAVSDKPEKDKDAKGADQDDDEPVRETADDEGERPEGQEGEEQPAQFDFGKKKKPKKKPAAEAAAPAEGSAAPGSADQQPQQPWVGTDRDYSYEELAGRIYTLLHNLNPDMGEKKKRYVMKPPQVCREGTKKTVWINFAEICTILHRKADHVLNYVLAELGTNGSIDGNHRLVIKGRFQPKQIENVIRHYISEYVACRTCKSPDTNLKKENRLYFLCCEACGSTRSVAAIKKGFEAQVGKRKKEKE